MQDKLENIVCITIGNFSCIIAGQVHEGGSRLVSSWELEIPAARFQWRLTTQFDSIPAVGRNLGGIWFVSRKLIVRAGDNLQISCICKRRILEHVYVG